MVQCSPFQPGLHSHLPSRQVPCSAQRGWQARWSHAAPIQPSSQRHVPPTQTPWPPQSAAQISVGKEGRQEKANIEQITGMDSTTQLPSETSGSSQHSRGLGQWPSVKDKSLGRSLAFASTCNPNGRDGGALLGLLIPAASLSALLCLSLPKGTWLPSIGEKSNLIKNWLCVKTGGGGVPTVKWSAPGSGWGLCVLTGGGGRWPAPPPRW